MTNPQEAAPQPQLPGIEWRDEAIPPEDLALLPVGIHDMSAFMSIEDGLEKPADEQLESDNRQAAADAYVEASEAYKQAGFFIKAASLRGKAAGLYFEAGNVQLTQLVLIEAIDLDRMSNNMAKLAEEQDHDPKMPLRANYPALHIDSSYRRGQAKRNHYSSNYVIFQLMNAHYSLLFKAGYPWAGRDLARRDMYELNEDLAWEYEHMRGYNPRLFNWEQDGRWKLEFNVP